MDFAIPAKRFTNSWILLESWKPVKPKGDSDDNREKKEKYLDLAGELKTCEAWRWQWY